jgi:hypothetical protein
LSPDTIIITAVIIICMDYKPGQLVTITEFHKVACEATRNYARVWHKEQWPYTHPEDLDVLEGQVCLVLEETQHWDYFNIWTMLVMIENPEQGYVHFMARINAKKVRRLFS